MSFLIPESTQQEFSGLSVNVISGVYLASGISFIQGGGSTVSVTSGNISVSSGEVHVMSGTIGVSGIFIGWGAGPLLESGIGNVSGVIPVALVAWDLSGGKYNPLAVSNSGLNILNTAASVSISPAAMSGQWLASGIVLGTYPVSVSSGSVSIASGSITINSGVVAVSGLFGAGVLTAGVVSGTVSVSGLFAGGILDVAIISGVSAIQSGSITINSGQVAVSGLFAGFSGKILSGTGLPSWSGAIPVIPLIADYSGLTWNPMNVLLSGGNDLTIKPAFKARTYQASGYLSVGAGASGLASVPNASGGLPLASAFCVTVTIRNLSGNAPIFVGYSGNFPMSGGALGFPLYGGDGLTLDVGPNMNLVYVVAQTSGTAISHFCTYYV